MPAELLRRAANGLSSHRVAGRPALILVLFLHQRSLMGVADRQLNAGYFDALTVKRATFEKALAGVFYSSLPKVNSRIK